MVAARSVGGPPDVDPEAPACRAAISKSAAAVARAAGMGNSAFGRSLGDGGGDPKAG